MIEIISPAGFENFFRELAHLTAAGPPPFDTVAALAASYGLEFCDAPCCPTSSSARSVTAAAKFRRFAARLPSRDNVDSSGEHTSYAAAHI